MLISSTRRPHGAAVNSSIPSTQKTPDKKEQATLKPLTERWLVGEESYASTQDLVTALGQDAENVAATYVYTTDEAESPFTKSEKIKNAIGSGIHGALGGALAGACAGAIFTLIAGVGDVLGGLMGGRMDGVANSVLTVPLALGTLAGLGVGAAKGFQADNSPTEKAVSGVLNSKSDGLAFYPGGKVDEEVDLKAFASAPTAEVETLEIPKASRLSNAAKGATAAALVPAMLIPLAGPFLPVLAGENAGKELGDRTTLGSGLGALAGVGATAGIIAAISTGGVQGGLMAAGVLGVAGAVIQDRIRAKAPTSVEKRDYGVQWWNNSSGISQHTPHDPEEPHWTEEM